MCGWNGNGWMWNAGYGGMGWIGWTITAVVLVLIFAALITAVVFTVRVATGGGHRTSGTSSVRAAEDILAERFARGEVDQDEYRQRTAALREQRWQP